jgi:predicted DsbA family dithiol-disulfide isomerase
MDDAVEVVEYTDLLCGWAWGAEPQLRALQWRYGDRLRWRRVLSCMVDLPPAATPDEDAAFAAGWAKTASETAQVTGCPWPPRIAPSPRSSVLPSLAVKAAERQGDAVADQVARRVRERLYVFGAPAVDADGIVDAVSGIAGFDPDRLRRDLAAPDVHEQYDADVEETLRPNDHAMARTEGPRARVSKVGDRWRYAYPSLVFRGPAGERTVCGWSPLDDYAEALDAVLPGAGAQPRPDPDPATLLRTLGSVTRVELALLCDGEPPPDDAVVYDCGGGALFLSPDEAATRGQTSV